MSDVALLRKFIREHIDLTQAVVKTDDDGDKVIRKLVKFKKNSTQFSIDDKVEADVNPETGNLDVENGIETWIPDLDGQF